jgi:hypothetical protein
MLLFTFRRKLQQIIYPRLGEFNGQNYRADYERVVGQGMDSPPIDSGSL